MDEEVFETGMNRPVKYTVTIASPSGRDVVEVTEPITLDIIDEIAGNHNMAKYIVSDADGVGLKSRDFPFSGDIVIKEYNAAKY